MASYGSYGDIRDSNGRLIATIWSEFTEYRIPAIFGGSGKVKWFRWYNDQEKQRQYMSTVKGFIDPDPSIISASIVSAQKTYNENYTPAAPLESSSQQVRQVRDATGRTIQIDMNGKSLIKDINGNWQTRFWDAEKQKKHEEWYESKNKGENPNQITLNSTDGAASVGEPVTATVNRRIYNSTYEKLVKSTLDMGFFDNDHPVEVAKRLRREILEEAISSHRDFVSELQQSSVVIVQNAQEFQNTIKSLISETKQSIADAADRAKDQLQTVVSEAKETLLPLSEIESKITSILYSPLSEVTLAASTVQSTYATQVSENTALVNSINDTLNEAKNKLTGQILSNIVKSIYGKVEEATDEEHIAVGEAFLTDNYLPSSDDNVKALGTEIVTEKIASAENATKVVSSENYIDEETGQESVVADYTTEEKIQMNLWDDIADIDLPEGVYRLPSGRILDLRKDAELCDGQYRDSAGIIRGTCRTVAPTLTVVEESDAG